MILGSAGRGCSRWSVQDPGSSCFPAGGAAGGATGGRLPDDLRQSRMCVHLLHADMSVVVVALFSSLRVDHSTTWAPSPSSLSHSALVQGTFESRQVQPRTSRTGLLWSWDWSRAAGVLVRADQSAIVS